MVVHLWAMWLWHGKNKIARWRCDGEMRTPANYRVSPTSCAATRLSCISTHV